MGGVRWDGKALQPPTQAQASVLGRAPRYMVNPTELSSSDWRAPQSRALGCSQYHMQANSEMRGALSSRPHPTASPVDDRLRGLSARTSRGSHSTYRKSGSAIFSDRETGNEREIQNGNGLEAKGAGPAWIGGGVELHAIAGAGAVGGRSTGGRRAPCGNRDTWDATAARAAHPSQRATPRSP